MNTDKINEIIRNKDIAAMLDDSLFEDAFIQLLYQHFYEADFSRLNHTQRILVLCTKLEDYCQADSITEIFEDGMYGYISEMYQALLEIKAVFTAELFKEFMDITADLNISDGEIPDFDEAVSDKIYEIDSKISDYPDGLFIDLFKAYLTEKENAAELFENIK